MLVTAAIGAVVGGVIGGIHSYEETGSVDWGEVAAGSATASTGAVMSGLGVAGAGLIAQAPVLGNKLEYIFGKASGSAHNIERSLSMLMELNRIGIFDNAEGRAYIINKLEEAYYAAQAIPQDNGRVLKEVFIEGVLGGAKLETIWEGEKLITVFIKGGGK